MLFAKPFVKWAGGKSQLLAEIRAKYPQRVEKYCEPFVGGGAVLFDVLQTFHPEQVLINDINAELMSTYAHVRDDVESLIARLADFQARYAAQTGDENKAFFYEQRDRYNALKSDGAGESLEKAALFIFLNKTCFNGLYRVNSRGMFNVPFNGAKAPPICDADNLRACSRLLQGVEMTAGDYSRCGDFIDGETFVYIDPPYRPLTQTASFTSYSEGGFSDKEQIALGDFIARISDRGALVLASNSDPKNTDVSDTFFDDLYAAFRIERVSAARMINADAKKRGAVSELLISNIASVF